MQEAKSTSKWHVLRLFVPADLPLESVNPVREQRLNEASANGWRLFDIFDCHAYFYEGDVPEYDGHENLEWRVVDVTTPPDIVPAEFREKVLNELASDGWAFHSIDPATPLAYFKRRREKARVSPYF